MRARTVAAAAVLAVIAAGAAWLVHAAPAEQRPPARQAADECPAALQGLPPFWAAIRGETVGSYVLDEVRLCPGTPQVVRRVQDDIGWVSSGGGVTAVVTSGGETDKVALLDGRTLRPLPALNDQGTVTAPAVSARGDLAVVVTDSRTAVQSLQVVRRGSSPQQLYTAPPGRELTTPSWNDRGDLLIVERPNPGVSGSVNLVLLRHPAAAGAATSLPVDRPNATFAMWLDDNRVVLADYVAAPSARAALFDVAAGQSRLLPEGLTPVAVPPGRSALLARDQERRLVLLTGAQLETTTVLGDVGRKLVGQGAFVASGS